MRKSQPPTAIGKEGHPRAAEGLLRAGTYKIPLPRDEVGVKPVSRGRGDDRLRFVGAREAAISAYRPPIASHDLVAPDHLQQGLPVGYMFM